MGCDLLVFYVEGLRKALQYHGEGRNNGKCNYESKSHNWTRLKSVVYLCGRTA